MRTSTRESKFPGAHLRGQEVFMFWTILVVLLILLLLGFSLHVGGGVIHLLLIFALVVLIFNVVTGRHRLA
ncbi:MAG: lmo0937 family membrane protein [Acidobacteriota bacterium]